MLRDGSEKSKWASSWSWQEDQIRVTLNGEVCKGLDDCCDRLKKLYKHLPELAAVIQPRTEGEHAIVYADAVKVMSECVRAGVSAIFAAIDAHPTFAETAVRPTLVTEKRDPRDALSPPEASMGIPPETPEQGGMIVNITHDGSYVIKREFLTLEQVQNKLASFASEQVRDEAGNSVRPILVRADRITPFKPLLDVLRLCEREDIKIEKVELAVLRPDPMQR
ncbi:MAG: biopolymer transporter ExbD [Planctomycetota bacterium]